MSFLFSVYCADASIEKCQQILNKLEKAFRHLLKSRIKNEARRNNIMKEVSAIKKQFKKTSELFKTGCSRTMRIYGTYCEVNYGKLTREYYNHGDITIP